MSFLRVVAAAGCLACVRPERRDGATAVTNVSWKTNWQVHVGVVVNRCCRLNNTISFDTVSLNGRRVICLFMDSEGIWHTGVVVYGKEYFFGGGIQSLHVRQACLYACVRASVYLRVCAWPRVILCLYV